MIFFFVTGKSEHIDSLQKILQWLAIIRIKSRILTMTYKALHDLALRHHLVTKNNSLSLTVSLHQESGVAGNSGWESVLRLKSDVIWYQRHCKIWVGLENQFPRRLIHMASQLMLAVCRKLLSSLHRSLQVDRASLQPGSWFPMVNIHRKKEGGKGEEKREEKERGREIGS